MNGSVPTQQSACSSALSYENARAMIGATFTEDIEQ